MPGTTCELGDGFCQEITAPMSTLVIFGASGDLAKRKLIPSLFGLYKNGLLNDDTKIIGCARTAMTDESFREKMDSDIRSGLTSDLDNDLFNTFLTKLYYISGGYDVADTYHRLTAKMNEIEKDKSGETARIYYLSTPANLYEPIVKQLGANGLVDEPVPGETRRRVVIEKPFGFDFDSAENLEQELWKVLKEDQIYRIDHYLAKETVQNILMLRFANMIFEPLWNNHYIDNIQITVSESIGVEHRAGFYEQSGLLRDMFQNHMLVMLCLVAMESPSSFESINIRNEKIKLLNSIRPWKADEIDDHFVRGQYAASPSTDEEKCAYREEGGVDSESTTETFVAAKLFIDNWRWKGVPFFLRSGKRLAQRSSEIAITFKQVPHSIFGNNSDQPLSPNVLVLNVQPDEGVSLSFNAKQPGPKLCMGNLNMEFKYSDVFGTDTTDAYGRLLLDSMLGEPTLFIRSDFISKAWELLTPVLEHWKKQGDQGLRFYDSGTWGPEQADELIGKYGGKWRNS